MWRDWVSLLLNGVTVLYVSDMHFASCQAIVDSDYHPDDLSDNTGSSGSTRAASTFKRREMTGPICTTSDGWVYSDTSTTASLPAVTTASPKPVMSVLSTTSGLMTEHKSWSLLGIICHYNVQGSLKRWIDWSWKGVIDCDGLGRWEKADCWGRDGAFFGPFLGYLKALIRKGWAPREQIMQAIRDSGIYSFSVHEINQMNDTW